MNKPLLQSRLDVLASPAHRSLLQGIRRGIEKESLRVDANGHLAATPHSPMLGSALTHPRITTDYSEALLEFITPASTSVEETLQVLDEIHRFTYHHIGDANHQELLWVNSMPCVLAGDDSIPVGYYGTSNIGRMKRVYREGLAHRYGKAMQTIAGIHYNWSLPDDCWHLLQAEAGDKDSLQDFKTARYFGLIRNFRRYFWLLLYLFGAAPVVCRSFVAGREHKLTPFGSDTHSLCAPLGTSLRMGDLGYQSQAQGELIVCYNNLRQYIKTLQCALTKDYPAYQAVGMKDQQGHYRQLNTHLLQIENEFYSPIRPKRTNQPGETPLWALWRRGVEYIEVRCLDLNPFEPLGINAQQAYFLETFLLYCLLADSPTTDDTEYRNIGHNQYRTVYQGRSPDLKLLRDDREYKRVDWGAELITGMAPVAELLDAANQCERHTAALKAFAPLLHEPEATPSASVLQGMAESGETYFGFALEQARQHRRHFMASALPEETEAAYRAMAEKSLAAQQEVEAGDTLSFEDFLAAYFEQYRFEL